MKKNKFLKLASGLLVLCLLTTCVISTTFAKYTTSGDAKDTARVAKWGVTVGVQAGTTDYGFAEKYTGTDSKVTVKATQDVVAPGTSGNLAYFSIKGTPEVALNLNVVVTNATDDNAEVDVFVKDVDDTYLDWTTGNDATDKFNLTEDYYPVKYTLWKSTDAGVTYTEVAAATDKKLSEIAAYIEGFSKAYYITDADADLTAWNALLGDYKITWEWAFEVNDKADTLLGNIIAGVDAGYGANVSTGISFELAITATQID